MNEHESTGRAVGRELGRAGAAMAQGLTSLLVRRAEEARLAADLATQRRESFRRQLRARAERERRARSSRKFAHTTPALGWWLLAIAALLAFAAVMAGHPGFVLIVGLFPGLRGARIVRFHHEREAPQTPPEQARFEETCNRLLATLRSGPARDFAGRPEATVSSLRRAWLDLWRRETALRSEAAQTPRLAFEGELLDERIRQATESNVRERLITTQEALHERRREATEADQRAELLGAEREKLTYGVEALLARAVRLGHASPDEASLAAVREDLNRLRDELGALADSLESTTTL